MLVACELRQLTSCTHRCVSLDGTLAVFWGRRVFAGSAEKRYRACFQFDLSKQLRHPVTDYTFQPEQRLSRHRRLSTSESTPLPQVAMRTILGYSIGLRGQQKCFCPG